MQRALPALLVIAALALLSAACARKPPVVATQVLDLNGLDENLRAVALAPDASFVVTSDMSGSLVARDLPSGEERWRVRVHSPGSAASIDTVVFSGDGERLALSGNEAARVELCDAATGETLTTLPMRNVRAVAFHPKERQLVLGANDALLVVDVESGEVTRTVAQAHLGDKLYAAAFSADGRFLATASQEGLVRTWEWPALTPRDSIALKRPNHESVQTVSVAVSPDGSRVAANAMQGELHVWHASDGALDERKYPSQATEPGAWHVEMYRSLAFVGDGAWLVAPDVHDKGLRIVDVEHGDSSSLLVASVPYFKGVAFSKDAGHVALIHPGNMSGAGANGIQVWKLAAPAK